MQAAATTDERLDQLSADVRTLGGRVYDLAKNQGEFVAATEKARREDINRVADKIERYQTHILEVIRDNHIETRERLVDVCDKGQKDHGRYDEGLKEVRADIADIRLQIAAKEGEERGRNVIMDGALAAGKFVINNGQGLGIAATFLIAAAVGAKTFLFPAPEAEAANVTVQAVAPPAPEQQGPSAFVVLPPVEPVAADIPLRGSLPQ